MPARIPCRGLGTLRFEQLLRSIRWQSCRFWLEFRRQVFWADVFGPSFWKTIQVIFSQNCLHKISTNLYASLWFEHRKKVTRVKWAVQILQQKVPFLKAWYLGQNIGRTGAPQLNPWYHVNSRETFLLRRRAISKSTYLVPHNKTNSQKTEDIYYESILDYFSQQNEVVSLLLFSFASILELLSYLLKWLLEARRISHLFELRLRAGLKKSSKGIAWSNQDAH